MPDDPRPIPTVPIVPTAVPVHRAEDLLAGRQEARIVLDEACYTLRLTRARKLILTK